MWAFFSRRARQYALLAVGVPVAAYVLDGVGKSIEERRGESGLTRRLRSGGDWLRGHGRGPIARRLRERDPGRA
jgi:hypothetical protein